MYRNQKVSIVLPAYNEDGCIRDTIEGFFAQPEVDEVIAVDNASSDATAVEIKRTRARYVLESERGYGSALQRGMREATGDIIVTVDSDGTYDPSDIRKLLAYSDDFDAVFTTRTHRTLISPGAFMPWPVRAGNWAVAKMLGSLFDGPSFTEVGCTFKLLKRRVYDRIKDTLTVKGLHFSPEVMIRVIQHGFRSVEIPVRYLPRVGTSKGTGNIPRSAKVGFRMSLMIIKERFRIGKRAKGVRP
jgi:glycosyltransferase involved in cell wall biosynthesis